MGGIVIIGGGIAALSAAEAVRKNNKSIPITLISDEKYLPYSRIKLSRYICQNFKEEELYLHKPEWYTGMDLNVVLSKKVVEINPGKSSVTIDDGNALNYESLIIACGSYPFIPPIKNIEKQGIFTVRKIDDIISIRKYFMENKVENLTVIGGGLLGLEAAWAFRESDRNINIDIVENLPRLLSRQMDEEGSKVLEDLLSLNSINLYTGNAVSEILGDKSCRQVILQNGTAIKSELIIISAGIRSNTKLCNGSNISANNGIIVDEYMRTNIKNIYAAGDCTEFNGNSWGTWPAAMDQGRIAGLNCLGIETKYKEIVPSNLLQIMGTNAYSAGDISNSSLKQVKYNTGMYTKLYFSDNLLKGFILIGDTKKGFALKRALEQEKDFSKELSNNINILEII